MTWRDAGGPARMQRVALVSPSAALRDALVVLATSGTVQLDAVAAPAASSRANPMREALRTLRVEGPVAPRLSRWAPDVPTLVAAGRADLLAGEAELWDVTTAAVRRGDVAALAGWAPVESLPSLTERLAPTGTAVCPLPGPRGVDPPTLLPAGGRVRRSFTALVDTYATVPYADVDPTFVAGAAYVVMFGMMFGDVGHGLVLVLAGLLLRAGRPARAAGVRRVWPFVVAAGGAAAVFGLLYGEFFGPTGAVPVLWLRPLEHPVTLLGVALGVGVVLLSGAYVVGTVNRFREGGWPLALVSTSGLAGAAVFAGAGCLLLGLVASVGWVTAAGVVVLTSGLLLSYVGFLATAERGAAGITQATVEVFDTTVRLAANVVSFARLAAFGLTHAALGLVVWGVTVDLWRRGGALVVAAVAAFLLGNAVAFALEALIAGVQALRLSYYELFSRVFTTEGRPFTPWRMPLQDGDTEVLTEVGEMS